jgi:hypothetical protein
MSILVWALNELHENVSSGNIDIPVEGNASLTSLQLTKEGGGNLTAVTVRRSLDSGATWGAERAITSGLPLSSDGDSLDIDFIDELVTAVRFTITTSAAMDLRIIGRAERR